MITMRGRGRKALAVLVATITLMIFLPLSAAAQSPEIVLDPTPVEVRSEDPFSVTLAINNIPEPGLAACDFTITFVPSVIQFGENVGDHDWTDPDFGEPFAFKVDNSAGSISFNDILMTGPYPDGSITLVTLHGTATATESASTALHFDKTKVLYLTGAEITATVVDGEVTVTLTSPPPSESILSPLQWAIIGIAILLCAFIIWFVMRRWIVKASKK